MPSDRYLDSWRLKSVLVNGVPFQADLVDRVFAASLDLSTDEISQFNISVEDPGLQLVAQGFFAKGQKIQYGDLTFLIASRTVQPQDGTAMLQLECRSAGAQTLKALGGALVRANISPTEMMAAEVSYVNNVRKIPLKFVGQPSARRPSVVRQTAGSGGGLNESSWDMGVRLAGELGYLMFESAGVLYFAQPTWLVSRLPAKPVVWNWANTDGRLFTMPTVRDSDDQGSKLVTGELSVDSDWGDEMLPGTAISLSLTGYSGTYFVTGMSMDLDSAAVASVSFATPHNPSPEAAV